MMGQPAGIRKMSNVADKKKVLDELKAGKPTVVVGVELVKDGFQRSQG